jgi:PAS domain-containing protein
MDSFRPTFESFWNLLHPDDRERVSALIRKALNDHQPFAFEQRIIRPDGQLRAFYAQGRVILDDAGNVIRMVGTAHDVTEREATLRLTESRLQAMINAEPACVNRRPVCAADEAVFDETSLAEGSRGAGRTGDLNRVIESIPSLGTAAFLFPRQERCPMRDFHESRPCVECDGTMNRRHGTLPVARPSGPADLRRIPLAHTAEIGTYYRCLKNGAHTVVVARDSILPAGTNH